MQTMTAELDYESIAFVGGVEFLTQVICVAKYGCVVRSG